MKTRCTSSLYGIAVAALLTGCTTGELPTGADAVRASDLGGPPSEARGGGAIVNRFKGFDGFEVSWDPARNLTWTIGLVTPLAEFCPDFPTDATFDGRLNFHEVFTPNGARHVLQTISGKATLVLYEGQPGPDLCVLADAPILATGTVTATTNDNDFFLTGRGGNSFGRRVTGTVTLADGTRAHLLLVSRGIILPHDKEEIIVKTVVDRFELRPIGR